MDSSDFLFKVVLDRLVIVLGEGGGGRRLGNIFMYVYIVKT